MKTEIKFTPNKQHETFVSDFLNPECKKEKYIMGMSRDGYALDVCKVAEINGFIDDFSSIDSFSGKPVFKSDVLSKDSLILVCSTVRTVTAVNNLKNKGFNNVLDYPSFFMHVKNPEELKLNIFDTFTTEFETNKDKFLWIYNLLKDEKSKEIFTTLIEYRLTANISLMADFSYIPNEQYFPAFLKLEKDVFADVGGFDGQTSLEFIKRCPDYQAVYLFEPSQSNINLAEKNLNGFSNIFFIDKGLSNHSAELKFDESSYSPSKRGVSETGTVLIQVDTLDNLVEEEITFIKVDIEGAESLALEGAKKHILNDHPKIAIAVYHKSDDFWQIPAQILAIRNDYDLHLRHYTQGTDETVMYFLPRGY
jgi:FkbM family methyltransferase